MNRIEEILLRTYSKNIFSIARSLMCQPFGPLVMLTYVYSYRRWIILERLLLVLIQGECRQLYEQITTQQEMKDLSAEYIPLQFLDKSTYIFHDDQYYRIYKWEN